MDRLGFEPIPDSVTRIYGHPITRCPPAPNGYKFVNEEVTFLPITRCFRGIDAETGEFTTLCLGDGGNPIPDGPDDTGTFGFKCTVTCQYESCDGSKFLNLEGKCSINPFPARY